MKDFILNLYNNEHFVLYLTIALVVLVVLFVIVLFLGRKDKKLQETKRLEKLNVKDTFKEEKNENKIEVKEHQENLEKEENIVPNMEGVMEEETMNTSKENIEDKHDEIQNDEEPTIVLPVVDDVPTVEPVAPVVPDAPKEIVEDNNVTMTEVNPQVSEPSKEQEENDSNEVEIQNLNFDEINNSLEKELTELENLKKQFNDIELPDSNLKEVVSSTKIKVNEEPKEEEKDEVKPFQPRPQVFSSVFVDKSEDEFELPTLKKNEEVPKEEKKEEKKPIEEFNTSAFRFDEINGETYNLNNK